MHILFKFDISGFKVYFYRVPYIWDIFGSLFWRIIKTFKGSSYMFFERP